MRSHLASIGELLGLALVSLGAGMLDAAAGVIVAGVGVFAMSWLNGGDG